MLSTQKERKPTAAPVADVTVHTPNLLTTPLPASDITDSVSFFVHFFPVQLINEQELVQLTLTVLTETFVPYPRRILTSQFVSHDIRINHGGSYRVLIEAVVRYSSRILMSHFVSRDIRINHGWSYRILCPGTLTVVGVMESTGL